MGQWAMDQEHCSNKMSKRCEWVSVIMDSCDIVKGIDHGGRAGFRNVYIS